MAPEALIVIGGGEHARVVIEAARSRPDLWEVVGFTDPSPCVETATRLRVAHLGDDREIVRRTAHGKFILGIGGQLQSPLRRRLVSLYDQAGARWASVIHQHACVSASAILQPGVVVCAGAVINSGARIGDHAIVNTSAVIEHDVEVGSFTHVAPAAVIGGGTKIGSAGFLGLGCRVRDHIQLGDGVTVGMGAAVIGSVEHGQTVMGVPARASRAKSHE